MKKFFYICGVYCFCIFVHDVLDEVINQVDKKLDKMEKKAKDLKVKGFGENQASESGKASCPLDRIGF